MKKVILIALFISLYSCSTTNTNVNRIAPGYVEAFLTLKNAFFGYENNIDPEIISKIPYASMLVRIGKGPESLMILESVSKDVYIWVSADSIYFVIKNGRIIKTSGLTNNLNQIVSSSLKWEEINYGNQIYNLYFSFLNPTLRNLRVTSNFKSLNIEKKDLIFGDKDLKLVTQTLASAKFV